jgi:hypothetical protein
MFSNYQSKSLSADVTRIVKAHNKLKEQTQVVLMGIAYQIANHRNADQLTRLVHGLSGYQPVEGEKVNLSPEAKAIGRYMRAHLPVKWDGKTQTFKVPEDLYEGFDFEEAEARMLDTPWHKFEAVQADSAFDDEKAWSVIVRQVKKILTESDKGSKVRDKAETIARQFAIEA